MIKQRHSQDFVGERGDQNILNGKRIYKYFIFIIT